MYRPSPIINHQALRHTSLIPIHITLNVGNTQALGSFSMQAFF